MSTGHQFECEVMYPAMGARVRSELVVSMAPRCADNDCLVVDEKQRTTVDGLYAAGDIVSDLHQISVAVGHAAIAATDIHRSLQPNFR
jgi:thioredoxin reductase (NADPH)